MHRNFRRLGTALFIGAAFFFLGAALVRQREELLTFDWQIEPVRLVLSTLLLMAVLAGGIGIWARILRHYDVRISFLALTRIWFLSSLGRYIPGKIWQFVGVAELSRAAQIPALVGITSLIVYMGFVVLGAWLISVYLIPAPALGPLAGLLPVLQLLTPGVLLLIHPRLLNGVERAAAKLLRRPLAAWRGTWASGVALLGACVLQWAGFGVAFYLFVSSLAADVSLAQLPALTAVFALAFLIGYLAFIAPAGLGAKEGALAILLSTTLSLPIGVAAAFAMASRVWSIAADLIPALVFLRGPREPIAEPSHTTTP